MIPIILLNIRVDVKACREMTKPPAEMLEMIVGNAEQPPKESGYAEGSMKTMREQMASLGMDPDDIGHKASAAQVFPLSP